MSIWVHIYYKEDFFVAGHGICLGSDDNTMPWEFCDSELGKKGGLNKCTALSSDDQLTGRVFVGSKIRKRI